MAKAREIPGLSADLAYGEVAARVVEVRCQELVDHSEGVLDTSDIERVHDMRVASRRLRAALEVFMPCFPPKQAKIGPQGGQGARRRARRAPRRRRRDRDPRLVRGGDAPVPTAAGSNRSSRSSATSSSPPTPTWRHRSRLPGSMPCNDRFTTSRRRRAWRRGPGRSGMRSSTEAAREGPQGQEARSGGDAGRERRPGSSSSGSTSSAGSRPRRSSPTRRRPSTPCGSPRSGSATSSRRPGSASAAPPRPLGAAPRTSRICSARSTTAT